MIRRASSGVMPIGMDADAADLSELDLPKLLLRGSGFYSLLYCFTHPLGVVKVRLQAAAVPMSTTDAVRDLYRTSGMRGLYAGFVPVVCGALPARVGYICALEAVRPAAQSVGEAAGLSSTMSATVSSAAGGFAAVLASQAIYTPCDVVTQRVMVADTSSGRSAVHVFRSIVASGGWRGLYRGFGVTLVAYLPGGSVWWGAYGGARAWSAERQLGLPNLLEQVLGATWASFCTVFVTSPLDVLKTRVQLSQGAVAPPLADVARQLLADEGLVGMYRGFIPRWGQAAIFTSSVISLYEYLKATCRKERESTGQVRRA